MNIMRKKLFSLVVYVPEEHADALKQSLFAAGAGRIGNYDSCAWQTVGQGQFRPLDGANPAIGSVNSIETVSEARIEMVCAPDLVEAVVAALHENHPYETPAYHLIEVQGA